MPPGSRPGPGPVPGDDAERLLGREDIAIRERTLGRLPYESAARAGEVLALGVGELEMPNRRAKVIRKGGAVDTITWRTRTVMRQMKR
jgi:integrase